MGVTVLTVVGLCASASAQDRVRSIPSLPRTGEPIGVVADQPGTTLRPIGPNGPPPSGLAVGGTPLVARLTWAAGSGVMSYALYRADGPSATPVLRTPQGFTATTLTDTVPDPRITYQYRLVANYADGTYGEAVASYVSPPLANPASLSVQPLAPGAFKLSWPAAPGADRYRVDGAGIPNTGYTVPTLSTNVINVPPGPQSWQVVALYPGNFADYTNPTRSSLVNRTLPPHERFLSKNNGAGSQAQADAHAARLCGDDGCSLIAGILQHYGVQWDNNFTYEGGPTLVRYRNVTELGRDRATYCFESVGKDDRYTVCFTESGSTMSLIIKGTKGTRFASLNTRGPWNAYWADKFAVTDRATFDDEGPKFTPHACLSCHGGRYDPASGLVQGATLLPIDPGLVDLGGQRAALEEPIRKVNELISRSGAPPAVLSYINGLYGGRVVVPGATAVANYVPSGWSNDANLYRGVIKKNCTMCHLATPSLNLLSAGNLTQNKQRVYNAVCVEHSMPHAEVPFRRFWTEDTGPLFAPGLLGAWLGYPSCQ
jgi:hypothetical protein